MKFISWNVNGLRACMKKGFLDFYQERRPDFLCLQETKMEQGQADVPLGEGLLEYWNSAEKKGYSGTAVFTPHTPCLLYTSHELLLLRIGRRPQWGWPPEGGGRCFPARRWGTAGLHSGSDPPAWPWNERPVSYTHLALAPTGRAMASTRFRRIRAFSPGPCSPKRPNRRRYRTERVQAENTAQITIPRTISPTTRSGY